MDRQIRVNAPPRGTGINKSAEGVGGVRNEAYQWSEEQSNRARKRFRVSCRGTDDRFVIVSLAKFHRFIIAVTFVHGESALLTIPKYINCIASTASLVNHGDGYSRLSWIHWKKLFRRLPGAEDSQWA